MVDSMLMFFGLTQVNDYYTISRIGTAKLLDVIYGRFSDKWTNLWSLYLKPYDALSPYQVKKNIKTVIDKMKNNSNIQSDLSRALSEDGTINYGKIVDEVKSGNRTLKKVFESAIETTKAGKETNELKNDMKNNPDAVWNLNIFGRTLDSLLTEGINGKLYSMPQDAQNKLQETMEKIINEGNGGLICILL